MVAMYDKGLVVPNPKKALAAWTLQAALVEGTMSLEERSVFLERLETLTDEQLSVLCRRMRPGYRPVSAIPNQPSTALPSSTT